MSKSFVDTLLELDGKSIRWNCEAEPADAAEFFKRAEQYNRMKKMENLIPDIDKCVPLTKFPSSVSFSNPNNGNQNHKYIVGSECSRVLYVQVNPFYFKGEKKSLERIAAEIEAVGEIHGADEISSEFKDNLLGGRTLEVRLWWD